MDYLILEAFFVISLLILFKDVEKYYKKVELKIISPNRAAIEIILQIFCYVTLVVIIIISHMLS